MLGKKDLGTTTMPPVETALVDGELAWRMHKGGHTTGPNLDTFVTWAARYIKNGSSPSAPSSPQPSSAAANRSATSPARVPAQSNAVVGAGQAVARTDRNSQIAHRQLVDKAKKGRIAIYFIGDSITRRWK